MAQTEPHEELTEDTILTGERNYESALDIVFSLAERELLVFDQDLSLGAYASFRRYELIRAFLAKDPHNRLTLVLHDAAYFSTRCPRLHDLLAIYGHAMAVYETSDQAKAAADCFVLVDGKHYVRRFHTDHARFRYALNDSETTRLLSLRFDELLEASSKSVTATRLGL